MVTETLANGLWYAGPTATIFSAFLGFLGGTIVNHLLAQHRADRERYDRQVDICQGLIGELSNISTSLFCIQQWDYQHEGDEDLFQFRLIMAQTPDTSFYETVRAEIGFLGWELCLAVHSHYQEAKLVGNRVTAAMTGANLLVTDRLLGTLAEFQRCTDVITRDLFHAQRPLLRRKDRKDWERSEREEQSWRAREAARMTNIAKSPDAEG